MSLKDIKDIPANPNSIENGLIDPTPEKGPKGSCIRTYISWCKGWLTKSSKDKDSSFTSKQ